MGSVEWVVQHLGLVMLSVICLGLTFYLIYCMIHPERF